MRPPGPGESDPDAQFRRLSDIHRAAHFEWRRVAAAACPDRDPLDLVRAFWTEAAHDTARAYLRRIDPSGDIAAQFADLFVASSHAMNERCTRTGRDADGREGVEHTDCPWVVWHRRLDLLHEDQPGCDHWLAETIAAINAALGTRLRFVTEETLPAGGTTCRRRFWCD